MWSLLTDGKNIAAWLEIFTFFSTAVSFLGVLWLKSKFVSRADLKETIENFQTVTGDKIDAVGSQVDAANKRIDEIVKLLIDRLPRAP